MGEKSAGEGRNFGQEVENWKWEIENSSRRPKLFLGGVESQLGGSKSTRERKKKGKICGISGV